MNKFILTSNNKQSNDIDLKLALKVLPKYLTLENLHKIDLINFAMM